MRKPIRVFYNELSKRFYATCHYKERTLEREGRVLITITGEKFDVTDDIARAITHHDLEFAVKK